MIYFALIFRNMIKVIVFASIWLYLCIGFNNDVIPLKFPTMANLFSELDGLKGARFIGFQNYESKTSGEISNYVINTNISVANIKKADFRKLQNCSDAILINIAKESNILLPTVRLALLEMTAAAQKNLSANIEDRTVASQAQTDAYHNVNASIRIHKETLAVHIFGMVISKTTLIKGEYKKVNSADKTIAKQLITKALKLSSGKFRTFIVENMDTVKSSGKIFQL
jgi:hypothetical protein